ncbi:hypothetical protein AAVH_24169 [Aphelenchoides avenae]|nr:hypothetical protein AAVH_24169 [Aphelenchus avenae]
MLLPNELLLGVLQVVDFSTLVSAKFVSARFLGVVTANDHHLAVQRRFNVLIFNSYMSYDDVMYGARRRSIRYERGDHRSFVAACRALVDVIGQHAVNELTFFESTCIMPGVDVIFEVVPALKFAQGVIVNIVDGSHAAGNPEAFMRNFARMKSLSLTLDNDAFPQFNWTFLGTTEARELQLIKLFGPLSPTEDVSRSVEELVRKCTTVPRLLDGKALEIDFSQSSIFSGTFGQRIIELLKGSGREVTFRMRTPPQGNDLKLDEREYLVDVDGATTRYSSKESGIAVEVNRRSITIQSTAELRPTKRIRRHE